MSSWKSNKDEPKLIEPEETVLTLDDPANSDIEFQTTDELEDELAKFRFQWKKELLEQEKKAESQDSTQTNKRSQIKIDYDSGNSKTTTLALSEIELTFQNAEPDLNYIQPKSNEEKANYLFTKGVLLEQQGRHYEAIKFYRMAMQLDADIEFKVGYPKQKRAEPVNAQTMTDLVASIENTKISENLDSDEDDTDQESQKTIYEQFQEITTQEGRFCEKNTPQKVSTKRY